jgi:hypothetical protein
MSSYLRYLLFVVPSVFVLSFVYSTATALTPNDVLSSLGLGRNVVEIGVRAGDIYAVSPDGARYERLCRLNLDNAFVTEGTMNTDYINSIDRALPNFLDLLQLDQALGVSAHRAPKDLASFEGVFVRTDDDVLKLQGVFTQLSDSTQQAGITDSCECAMARMLNKRQRVCTVRTSLISAQNPNLSAFNFARFSNMVPEDRFAQCGLPAKSDAARSIEAMECPNSVGHPWDVVVRKVMGVVQPVQLVPSNGL